MSKLGLSCSIKILTPVFGCLCCCLIGSLFATDLDLKQVYESPDGHCKVALVAATLLWPDRITGVEPINLSRCIVFSRNGIPVLSFITEERRTQAIWTKDSKYVLILDAPDKGKSKLLLLEVLPEISSQSVNLKNIEKRAEELVPSTEVTLNTATVESIEELKLEGPHYFTGIFRRAGGKKETHIKFGIEISSSPTFQAIVKILNVSQPSHNF